MVDQQISLEIAKFLGPRRLLLLILQRETVGIADAGPYLALADIAAQRLRLPRAMEKAGEWLNLHLPDADAGLLQSFGVDYFQGFHFGEPLLEPEWCKTA